MIESQMLPLAAARALKDEAEQDRQAALARVVLKEPRSLELTATDELLDVAGTSNTQEDSRDRISNVSVDEDKVPGVDQ